MRVRIGADPVRMGTGTDDMKVGVNMPRGKGTGNTSGVGTGTGTGKKKGPKRKYTISDKVLAQRRANTGTDIAKTPDEFAYNARIIQHAMQIQQISETADVNDVESMRQAFLAYLQLCLADGCKITNLGACAAMGVEYTTVDYWLKSDHRPDHKKLAQMVKRTCALAREQLISDGQLNPVIGIFWQRNYDGLRNDTEQIQNSIRDAADYEKKTAAELMEKYADQITD